MDRKDTQIISSFLGIKKKGSCPVCGTELRPEFDAPKLLLCPNCGEYIETAGKSLRCVEISRLLSQPTFAAPTPWKDMHSPRYQTISFSTSVEDYLKDALTDLAMKKKEGMRILDARWPEGCCVCGKQAVREEATAEKFTFLPPGVLRVRDHEATVAAEGIPHCVEHKGGACFGRATFGTAGHETVVGLLFRSYSYQSQFRKMNPWTWR
jgi:predicted RNA-binding Zn-ribbon protein involved in translation (DUF1610 family)